MDYAIPWLRKVIKPKPHRFAQTNHLSIAVVFCYRGRTVTEVVSSCFMCRRWVDLPVKDLPVKTRAFS